MGERADEATVLAVDDQRDQRDLYEARLGDRYDLRTASTGEEALDELDGDVDVVLLDRELPDVSGDDILERIRTGGYDCRVAMVTAVEPDVDLIDLGFDAYLTKPVSTDELVDTIERLLRRSTYSDAVIELFSLCERRATLLEQHSESELATNDEFQALTENIRELREETNDLVGEFGSDDYRAIFRDLP